MCLIAWIRALITTIVLASYSPLVIGHGQPDAERVGHLAISLFIGRRTRVAASQQFNVTNSAIAAKVPASGPATPSCEWRTCRAPGSNSNPGSRAPASNLRSEA